MAQTIEAFVEKLHAEGVQAGKEAADRLRSEAQAEADRILADAKAQAESTIANAKAEAERLAEQQRQELDLAARDATLRFRAAVAKAVNSLLRHEVSSALTDKEFLPGLIRDTVVNYAKEDAHSQDQIEIRVNPEMIQAVTDWALNYLGAQKFAEAKAHLDLKGTLKTQGFEYRVSESTVEVTVESIVEVLKEHVNPRLREVLDRAFEVNA